MLNLDFLRGSGVVPADWELAQQPVSNPNAAQIAFKNGIRIEAQPGTVSFSEGIGKKKLEEIQVPNIARRYAAALPNLDYQGVGINPRRFVTFEGQGQEAHKFITETILARGSWQQVGIAPMQAGINLVYSLESCQLGLSINEVKLQSQGQEPIAAVLFGGNFSYPLAAESVEERLEQLHRALENWRDNLAAYRELLDQKFLAGGAGEAMRLVSAFSFSELK
jgi:hypothetical protein